MNMRDSLSADGCDIVLEFFHFLLKISNINKTGKPIDVGEAMNQWNLQKFGKSRYAMTRNLSFMSRLHRLNSAAYDNRRDWLKNNPKGLPEEAAEAWKTSRVNAMNWIRNERRRQSHDLPH